MKITTTAGQLADLLGRVARAVATRSTSPVLQGLPFRAHQGEGGSPGSLAMAATDTEISLTLNASAPVEEAGAAVIPAKALLRYARSLPKGADVTLQASETERTATLSSGKSSVTLRCFPADDFPAPAVLPQEDAFAVPTEALASSIARVLPFASADESRPVLTGVLVEFEDVSARPVARLVATASYRLGVDEADLGTQTMDVSLTENACAFSVGGGALVLRTRLIGGNYPEYRHLLPDGFAHTFRASREDLSAALNRVRLLAAETPPTPLTLLFAREEGTLGEGELRISLQNSDRGGAAAEVVPAKVPDGTNFSACFNPNYLADAVASLEADDLEFCFNGPLKPAILRAAAASNSIGRGYALNLREETPPCTRTLCSTRRTSSPTWPPTTSY